MNGRHTPGCRPALAHTAVLATLLLATALLRADPPPATAAASARIAELRTAIAHHDELYFRHATPEITDTAYDALKRELAALEREHPDAAAGIAPLPILADDHSEGFARSAHLAPMLGLEKTYTEEELRTWYAGAARLTGGAGLAVVVEPKIDGVAVSATYEHGALVRVLTRGNGTVGDDVTATARRIRSLPPRLAARGSPTPARIELRGEVYVGWSAFTRLNREREAAGEEPAANPRNLAAGILKQLAPSAEDIRALDVLFYNWGACAPAGLAPTSQRVFCEWARRQGLPTIDHVRVATDADSLRRAVQELARGRRALPYPIDGAVAKVDDVRRRAVLGENNDAPRWAVAYKFVAERATTRLHGIAIQVGRTGRLTPVAEFEPVALAGSRVGRASLHNPALIARLDVRPGDHVVVEKSGEIIPQIVAVDLDRRPPGSTPYVFLANCPECGAPVVFSEGRTEARCPNGYCAAKVRARIEHFADCVEMKGLGPATVATLVAHGLVRDPGDLYRLRREQLVALPRVGEKTAAALLRAIERSRRAEPWRVIAGLGIPRVGPATAKELAKRYGSLAALLTAPAGELSPLVGEAAAQELAVWFAEPRNRELGARLAELRGEKLDK